MKVDERVAPRKKPGLLTKVAKSFKKLSLKKGKSNPDRANDKVQSSTKQQLWDEEKSFADRFGGDYPKSATLRETPKFSMAQKQRERETD